MAVIKRGILGGFSGKIANVVGSAWKGIAVIKSLPLSVANPKTAAQTANRNQFSQCVAFATAILVATIKPLLDRIAVQMSGYNLFVQLNKDFFDADGLSTVASLVIAQGTVTDIDTPAGATDAGNDQINCTYVDNTASGDALGTDVLYGCVYNVTKNLAISMPFTSTRADEALVIPTPTTWADGDVKELYFAYRKADGSRTSNTVHVQAT